MGSRDRQTVRVEVDPILVVVVGDLAEDNLEVVLVDNAGEALAESAAEVLVETAAVGSDLEVVLEEAPEAGSRPAEGIRILAGEEDRNYLVEARMTLLVVFG